MTQTNQQDPAALVALAQQGDAEAFGRLYDQYVNQVYGFVFFRTGNRQLAEDLTADTFYRALKSINSWSYVGKDVGCWLYTIARRLIIDHRKSAHTRFSLPVPDLPPGIAVQGQGNRTPEAYPERSTTDHLITVEVLKAVKGLRKEHRDVIILRFLLEESVQQTAQIMGRTPGAVKQLQVRALGNLRRALPHLANRTA